jgi:hypothetical protein
MIVQAVVQGDLFVGATLEIPREDLLPFGFQQADRFLIGRQTLGQRWKVLSPCALEHDPWLKRITGLKRTSEMTEEDWVERVRMFLPDLYHPDPLISSTAFGEIARAPYAAMRANRERIDNQRLMTEWESEALPTERRALYVLLLGICGDAEVDKLIDEHLSILSRSHATQGLAAWLVAKLERAGPMGLSTIKQHYLLDPHRSQEECQAAYLAMSIQGSGNPVMFRDEAVAIYREALESGHINVIMISDLTSWSRWEMRDQIQKLLVRSDLVLPVREAIQSYLSASSE